MAKKNKSNKLVKVNPPITKDYGLKLDTKNKCLLFLGCYYLAGETPDIVDGDDQNVFLDEKYGVNLYYKKIDITNRKQFLSDIGLVESNPTRMMEELEKFTKVKHMSWVEYHDGKAIRTEIKGQSPIILLKEEDENTKRVRKWTLLVGGYDVKHKYFASFIKPLIPHLHNFSLYGIRLFMYLVLQRRFNLKNLKDKKNWIVNFNRKKIEQEIGINKVLDKVEHDMAWLEIIYYMRQLGILNDCDLTISKETRNRLDKVFLQDTTKDHPIKMVLGDYKKTTTRQDRKELDRERKKHKTGEYITFNIDLSKFGNVKNPKQH